MRMVCISKNKDILLGLRIAGVEVFHIKDDKKIIEKIQELASDANVGILNVTEDVYDVAEDEIKQIQNNQEMPLIVKIPNTK